MDSNTVKPVRVDVDSMTNTEPLMNGPHLRISCDYSCSGNESLPTTDGIANNCWHCRHLLVSHVIWKGIYSPRSSRRKYKFFSSVQTSQQPPGRPGRIYLRIYSRTDNSQQLFNSWSLEGSRVLIFRLSAALLRFHEVPILWEDPKSNRPSAYCRRTKSP